MADWLKWCKGLPRKPQVIEMARQLGRSRHEVASLCMEVWEWAEDNATVDASAECPGFVRIVSASVPLIDDAVGVSGLADAMVSVGWLAIRTDRLEFPKFSRHNGSHAKRRALDAVRKRADRVRKTSATDADDFGASKNGGSLLIHTVDKSSTGGKKILGEYPKSFEEFWKCYPLKAGKQAALRAWTRAGKRIRKNTGIDGRAAAEVMRSAAEAFAASDKAQGEFCPHPATWLNKGHYDDDPVVWKDRGQPKQQDFSITDVDLGADE